MPPVKRKRFEPIPGAQFASITSAKWIIKQVLSQTELAVIYGPSYSGKTYLTMALCMAIAYGDEWFKHRTHEGRVVYIAAEAEYIVSTRLYGFCLQRGIKPEELKNFDIIPDCPNLMEIADAKTIAAMVGTAKVIVIDTFARVMAGGDENNGQDVGKVIRSCQELHKLTGALIILVHHTGKNTENGARGWSGLKAAVDTEISVEKLTNCHCATITKQRAGMSGEKFGFTLEPRVLAQDEDGDDIVTCDFIPMGEAPKEEKRQKMGLWKRHVMEAFNEKYIPTINSFVPIENVIQSAVEKVSHDPSKPKDRRREYAFRALDELVEDKVFSKSGNILTKS